MWCPVFLPWVVLVAIDAPMEGAQLETSSRLLFQFHPEIV